MHTVIGMGGAALAAAVPSLIRRPEFPARDNGVLQKKEKKKKKKMSATEHNVLPY